MRTGPQTDGGPAPIIAALPACVVVAFPWRTWPIRLHSIPEKGFHQQTVGTTSSWTVIAAAANAVAFRAPFRDRRRNPKPMPTVMHGVGVFRWSQDLVRHMRASSPVSFLRSQTTKELDSPQATLRTPAVHSHARASTSARASGHRMPAQRSCRVSLNVTIMHTVSAPTDHSDRIRHAAPEHQKTALALVCSQPARRIGRDQGSNPPLIRLPA